MSPKRQEGQIAWAECATTWQRLEQTHSRTRSTAPEPSMMFALTRRGVVHLPNVENPERVDRSVSALTWAVNAPRHRGR